MPRHDNYTPAVLPLLAGSPNRALDAALVEAIVHTQGAARGELCSMLFDRGHAPALMRLINRFGIGDNDLDRRMTAAAPHLESALRSLTRSGATTDRLAAVALIRQADDAAPAYLLGDLVGGADPRAQESAAEALTTLTTRLLMRCCVADGGDDEEALRAQVELLASAYAPVFQRWELHLNRPCLISGLWLGHHVRDIVATKLAQPRNGLEVPITRILTRTRDPRLAGFLIAALSIPALRATAARTIASCRDITLIESIVERADRLRDPAIRQGCKFVKNVAWLSLAADQLLARGDRVMGGVVDFLGACGGSAEHKIPVYRRVVNGGTPPVRRHALRAAVDDLGPKAMPLLTAVAIRDDELAMSAARLLPRAQVERGTPQRRDTPAARYFCGQLPLTPASRDTIAADLNTEPGGAIVALRARLSSANSLDKARALHLARVLGLLPELKHQVYRLVHDPDPAVRSVAVAALVHLPAATSRRLARSGMDDADERVRAGAIEAMDILDVPDRASATAPLLTSRDQRQRANAVKSLLGLHDPRAAETLLDMLDDPSPAHRLSGLWVVDRMGLRSTRNTLRMVAERDGDERVRARAVELLEKFERSGGTGPVVDHGSTTASVGSTPR